MARPKARSSAEQSGGPHGGWLSLCEPEALSFGLALFGLYPVTYRVRADEVQVLQVWDVARHPRK